MFNAAEFFGMPTVTVREGRISHRGDTEKFWQKFFPNVTVEKLCSVIQKGLAHCETDRIIEFIEDGGAAHITIRNYQDCKIHSSSFVKIDNKTLGFSSGQVWVETEQAQGTGTQMFVNAYHISRILGLKRMTVNSEMMGSYSWLMLGVLPYEPPSKSSTLLMHRLNSVKEQIPPEVYGHSKQLIHSDNPEAWRALARIRDAVIIVADRDGEEKTHNVTLGNAMVWGADWKGQLNFEHIRSMDIFYLYAAAKLGQEISL